MSHPVTEMTYRGVFRNGVVEILGDPPWTEGCYVEIQLAPVEADGADDQPELVIVAGFGLAGRWAAEVFDRRGMDYVIVEKNPVTVRLQEAIGRTVLQGDITEEETLLAAGIERADVLALTIPDEQAVLVATALARRLNPNVYIIARTTFTSKGMEAKRLGADAVIKAEQAVADRFYQLLMHRVESVPCRVASGE